MRDLHNVISSAVSIAPAANRTASINGTGVDLAGFRAAVALVQWGTVTDGTWTATIEESDDNSSFATATDISGAFVARTSANDETVEEVSYTGSKRYIRVVVTETVASTTGAIFNALIVRGEPLTAPA
jgi:hypothetical protein